VLLAVLTVAALVVFFGIVAGVGLLRLVRDQVAATVDRPTGG
jgi:hypothetical protein